jgi:hypothetical protein
VLFFWVFRLNVYHDDCGYDSDEQPTQHCCCDASYEQLVVGIFRVYRWVSNTRRRSGTLRDLLRFDLLVVRALVVSR